VGATIIDQVIGVAATQPVLEGEGPFPTELPMETLGRYYAIGVPNSERQPGVSVAVGWFDTVIGRYAVRINEIWVFSHH
jgi:adenylosuccinate synthase